MQVFLKLRVLAGGALELASLAGLFGSNGAYLLVDEAGTHAASVPIHETFVVRLDHEGTLRTDHHVKL